MEEQMRIGEVAQRAGVRVSLIRYYEEVGLLPEARPPADGVRLLPLREPRVALRAYALARPGRTARPPLALVLRLLRNA